MQKLMENWRAYHKEALIEEGVVDIIRGYFQRAPAQNHFDPAGQYGEGTYGAFAQANGVLAAMQDQNMQKNKANVAKVVTGLVGGATGGEGRTARVGGALGATVLALAGLVASPAVAIGLTAAGVSAVVISLMAAAQRDPTKAQKYPLLGLFQIDQKWRDILDDDLEDVIEGFYSKDFMEKLQQDPHQTMEPLNAFLQRYIGGNYEGRNVTKPEGL